MRHIVNFGLLFSFATLATTGVVAFLRPFSITTTRIHVVFGLTTAVLVALHLMSRIKYFRSQLTRAKTSAKSSQRVSRAPLIAIVAGWVGLLSIVWMDWMPASWLMSQGYESSNRAAIVRQSPLAGFLDVDHVRQVARKPKEIDNASVALTISFDKTKFSSASAYPSVVVWAETTTGALIETLYLDERLAYSDKPTWGGRPTARNEIFPIWRHRYTMVSGVDPTGEVDAFTGATATHSFTLDNYLTLGEETSFILAVEVNQPHDPNEVYSESHIGQPSLLYTALIDLDSDQRHVLLELTGHGGGAEKSGAIQYDLEAFTSARDLVDLLLAKTQRMQSQQ